jgi:hypothetical protein
MNITVLSKKAIEITLIPWLEDIFDHESTWFGAQ